MNLELPVEVLHYDSRQDWLAARETLGIGSSDVPAIVGVSRFASALSLYYDKLGLSTRDTTKYQEFARWGNLLEEPISQRYAEETKRVLVNPNADGKWSIAQSATHPFMIASADRFVIDTPRVEGAAPPPPGSGVGVLEVKNAHLMMAHEWTAEHNNEPPVEYQVQLQHQLAVTGAQWGSIAALIGGCLFVWADLARDEALIARLIELETEFMGRLERREPPAADGSESSRAILAHIYPKDKGTSVVLPPEAIDWHKGLIVAKTIEKLAKADIENYSNLLRQQIGDATVGVLPGGAGGYTWKWQERKEYVVPAGESRVLRYTKK